MSHYEKPGGDSAGRLRRRARTLLRIDRRPPLARVGFRTMVFSRFDRTIFLGRIGVPLNIAVGFGKLGLAVESLSLALLTYGLYNFGVAFAKHIAVRQHDHAIASAQRAATVPATVVSGDPSLAPDRATATAMSEDGRSALRLAGLIVAVASLLYALSCVPALFSGAGQERYTQPVAIAIATIAFTEIVLAIVGLATARRNREYVIEAIKLTNLAGALVLLVLTQTALLSFASEHDTSFYNALAGVLLGSAAAGIGGLMILRSRPRGTAHRSAE